MSETIITAAEAADILASVHTSRRFRRAAAARLEAAHRGIPVALGGAPNPVSHPLLAPTISGNDITVDTMLKQPTRVTRLIADLTLQRFIADRLFSSSGGVSGGAVIYDQATENELYSDRDVQRVQPASEFPIVSSERPAPKVAEVEKWGGKFFMTDEAIARNDSTAFTNESRKLANTIVRKLNARTIQEVNTSISGTGQTFTSNKEWDTIVTGGSSQDPNSDWPLRDFVHARVLADQKELGVNYNLVLLNPIDWGNLVIVYGAGNIAQLLSTIGYSYFVSNRVPAGTAYFVEEGAVGEMRLEKPLGTERWREEKTEREWVQTSVRPVMFVTNPYAVVTATGIS